MDSMRSQNAFSDFKSLFEEKHRLYRVNENNSDDRAVTNSCHTSKEEYLSNLATHIVYSYQICQS